jgi:hypothetical protein
MSEKGKHHRVGESPQVRRGEELAVAPAAGSTGTSEIETKLQVFRSSQNDGTPKGRSRANRGRKR